MKIKCLSVQNPLSFLICCGVKDVENRTWKTSYRGKIYIHSSGNFTDTYINESDLPLDFDTGIQEKLQRLKEKNILKKGDLLTREVYEKNKKLIGFNDIQEKLFLLQLKAIEYKEKTKSDFFVNSAIIGSVELIDIITNSESIFANEGNNHWILKNSVLFKKPLLLIKGKLGLWEYELTPMNEKIIQEIDVI